MSMFQVHWKYRGQHDRILLLMPPIIQSLDTIEKHPFMLQKCRTTLQQLCTQDSIQFIVAHIPSLNTSHFKSIERIEEIYGIEVRILESLSLLIDKNYEPYLTNECLYLLKNSDEWLKSITPWEWYFNVCIVDQLHQYYDASSKLLQEDFKYDGEVTVGANYVYESVCASLNMSKKITINENILRTLVGMQSDFNEGDVVLMIGTIGDYEKRELRHLLDTYIKECRLTAVYMFGHARDTYKDIFEEFPEVEYHTYTQPLIDKTMMEWLWTKFKKHGPRYNSYVFIGSYTIESSNVTTWETLEKPFLKACIYTPEAWSSLHPSNILHEKHPFTITLEPFGLLHYFLNGNFQIEEDEDKNNDDDNGDDDNDTHKCTNC
jgi:hypothetical protein